MARFPRILSCVVAVFALALVGCGSSEGQGGSGAGISCGVGETVALDSQGNKFCQKAGADGTISGTDTGGTGGADTGGTGGADTGGTGGGTDGGAGSDGGAKDAGPSDPWWTCPPVKGTGLDHGKKCTKHEECLYGYCMKGGHLTGYDDSISYCTKNNGCTGGDAATCAYDDNSPSGVTYKSAFEKSKSGGNTKRTSDQPVKVCARACKSDSECKQWNADLPDCIKNSTKYVSIGTQGVCGKNPLK